MTRALEENGNILNYLGVETMFLVKMITTDVTKYWNCVLFNAVTDMEKRISKTLHIILN